MTAFCLVADKAKTGRDIQEIEIPCSSPWTGHIRFNPSRIIKRYQFWKEVTEYVPESGCAYTEREEQAELSILPAGKNRSLTPQFISLCCAIRMIRFIGNSLFFSYGEACRILVNHKTENTADEPFTISALYIRVLRWMVKDATPFFSRLGSVKQSFHPPFLMCFTSSWDTLRKLFQNRILKTIYRYSTSIDTLSTRLSYEE